MTWRDHGGGACPVHPKALVRVRWANGALVEREYPAGGLRWSKTGHPFDISSYQVTEVPEEVAL